MLAHGFTAEQMVELVRRRVRNRAGRARGRWRTYDGARPRADYRGGAAGARRKWTAHVDVRHPLRGQLMLKLETKSDLDLIKEMIDETRIHSRH
jgi:hypothetical protein